MENPISVKGKVLDFSGETNTLEPGGGLEFDYNSIGGGIRLEFNKLFGSAVPLVALFGEAIYNPDPPDENLGYLAGLVFGEKKVKIGGQWQVQYSYRRLERDAWLDTFPDSDFYGGETNSKGHEIIFKLGLAKNINFGLDYYYTENIEGDNVKEQIIQLDILLKF